MWTLEQVGETGDPVIALTYAKTHLRVTHNAEDTLISRLVQAATEHAEVFQLRTLLERSWRLTLPRFPQGSPVIRLPRPPVQSITSIVYTDPDGNEQTMPGSQYRLLDDGRIYLAVDAWPSTASVADAVQITYVAGYDDEGDLPAATCAAILLLVGNLYENREAALVSTGPAFKLPLGAETLLWPHRTFERDPLGGY